LQRFGYPRPVFEIRSGQVKLVENISELGTRVSTLFFPNLVRLQLMSGSVLPFRLQFFHEQPARKKTVQPLAPLPATFNPDMRQAVLNNDTAVAKESLFNILFVAGYRGHALF
jgi:hypothetical protein